MMAQYQKISDFFEDEPATWGLRGDRYLWREMRAHFSDAPIPENVSLLEKQVLQAFLELTGQPISTQKHFRVAQFAHGGLSSGGISPGFWRNRALPLLKKRYTESFTFAGDNK